MQTLTIEITNDNAIKMLQDLEEKHYIKILSGHDLSSPVFPGEPLTTQQFQEWVSNRESGKTISLEEVKNEWLNKRKKLFDREK